MLVHHHCFTRCLLPQSRTEVPGLHFLITSPDEYMLAESRLFGLLVIFASYLVV